MVEAVERLGMWMSSGAGAGENARRAAVVAPRFGWAGRVAGGAGWPPEAVGERVRHHSGRADPDCTTDRTNTLPPDHPCNDIRPHVAGIDKQRTLTVRDS